MKAKILAWWILLLVSSYSIGQNISRFQYYFDNDPSIGASGNGGFVNASPPSVSVSINTSIPTAGLAVGFHTLYIRAQYDNGLWGMWSKYPFTISPPPTLTSHTVTQAEYFFDNEPGIANAIPLPDGFTPSDVVSLQSAISTTGLPTGFHTLYIRFKDSKGHWGMWRNYPFVVSPPPTQEATITDGEVFFDSDPGVGNGIQIWTPFSAGNEVTFSRNVFMPNTLANGTHHVYVRLKDANGKWSLHNRGQFDLNGTACNLSASVVANGPTTFCTGNLVTLTENTMGQLSWQWKLNGNDIAGATSRHYIATENGDYTCTITSGSCSSTSNMIFVSVNAGTTWYADMDADGYGNAATSVQACLQPAGYISDNTDCDDAKANVYPGATEVCDELDNDCDGTIDEGVQLTFYEDADGDGFGNPAITTQACSAPAGYVSNSDDCNDADADINPNTIWYLDADNDNYYTGTGTIQCTSPGVGYKISGLIADGDCNDENAAINPEATEICNGIDDDCDGQIDEGVQSTFYRDADGDGFGNPVITTQACSAPAGYVSNSDDCNDNDATTNPNTIWYLDADNDNYYTGAGITQCASPGVGYKTSGMIAGGDCNDENVAIKPGAIEICNGTDDDCDGQIDEGVLLTFYQDADGDGYGNPVITTQACAAPAGYVSNSDDCNDNDATLNPTTIWYLDADNDNYYTGTSIAQCASPGVGYKISGLIAGGDCDDGNAAINPDVAEICNGIDDDCDGQIDEGVQQTFYRDNDGDGYGNTAVTIQACFTPSGYVSNNTDCDDTKASVYPGATETCNGIDDNCDGQIDENVQSTFYRDADGDGFGNPEITTQACAAPAGYVSNSDDCNDADASINPNTIWYLDADNDNYYTGIGIIQCSSPGVGYKISGLIASGDCNDGNLNIHPGATEICGNNIDDNCNGQVDENCIVTKMYRSKQNGYWHNVSTWQVSVDGGSTWTNATATPTSLDGTITIRNNHTVTIIYSVTIDEVIIAPEGILTVLNTDAIRSGLLITVSDGLGDDLVVDGTFNLKTVAPVVPDLVGSGSVLINGTLNWEVGNIKIKTVLAPSSMLNISPGRRKSLGSDLINNGTVNWLGGALALQNGNLINNLNFNISANYYGITNSSGTNLFTNSETGIVTRSGTDAWFSIDVPFINKGSIRLNSALLNNGTFTNKGSINFSNGAYLYNRSIMNFEGGTILTGSGNIFNQNGNFNVNAPINIPEGIRLVLGEGNFTGSGSLIVNGAFDWYIGNLNCSTTIANTSILTIYNLSPKALRSSLTNNGTINWTNGDISFQNGVLTNNGNFNIATYYSNSLLNSAGVNSFVNNSTGIITRTVFGSNTSSIVVPFTNSGLIQGLGRLNFSAITNNGIIAPGITPGSIGSLIVNSNTTSNPLTANSELKTEIKRGDGKSITNDLLQKAGNLTLNGKLTVTEIGNIPNGTYEIIRLTSGTISGDFNTLQLPPGYSLQKGSNYVRVIKSNVATRMANPITETDQKEILYEKQATTLALYPNPADQQLTLKPGAAFSAGKLSLQIVDRNGAIVKRSEYINSLKGQAIILNTTDLASGLYLVVITDSKGTRMEKKVVIAH